MTQDPRDSRIAALLAESYEMLGHLGRGGFATVYRVRNRRLNRIEALKVLSADLEDPDFAERFKQEARVAASLDHPRIVKIFDFGQAEDLCWFTMQFVEGPTLIRELKQKGPWTEAQTAALAAAVADALAYSHERGIIHRDIKPENVLVDGNGRPFLMDFGIAKSDQSVVHTRTGTVLGSPAYIAPEQLTGGSVDGRADIYSLGATMYRMVSNSFPFQDSDPVRMAMKRFTMDPEPLAPKRPGIDPAFEGIVMHALAREPADRFRTAAEMASALREFLAGRPVTLPAPPAPLATVPPEGPPTADALAIPGLSPTASAPDPATVPTVRTRPPASPDAVPAAAASRYSSAATRIAAAVAVLVIGGALALLRRTSPDGAPEGRPGVPVSVPAAVPSAARSVTRAPSEPPVSAERLVPSAAPFVIGGRVGRQAASSGARAAESAAAARPTAAAVRRAVFPPQSETEAPIELPAATAREFANQSVGLSVLVGEDGSVKEARVISPLCPECDRAARAAILLYRFKPARDQEGRPVESRVAVPVIISAPENP